MSRRGPAAGPTDVKILEVQRCKAEQLGINLNWFGTDGFFGATSARSSLGRRRSTRGDGGGQGAFGLLQGGPGEPELVVGVIGNSGVFSAFIQALRDERLLKIMAEPVQIASNGRPSYFQAGGCSRSRFRRGWARSRSNTKSTAWNSRRCRSCWAAAGCGWNRGVGERLDFSRAITLNGTTVPAPQPAADQHAGRTGLRRDADDRRPDSEHPAGRRPEDSAAWANCRASGRLFRRVRYEEAETELVILVTPHPVAGLPRRWSRPAARVSAAPADHPRTVRPGRAGSARQRPVRPRRAVRPGVARRAEPTKPAGACRPLRRGGLPGLAGAARVRCRVRPATTPPPTRPGVASPSTARPARGTPPRPGRPRSWPPPTPRRPPQFADFGSAIRLAPPECDRIEYAPDPNTPRRRRARPRSTRGGPGGVRAPATGRLPQSSQPSTAARRGDAGELPGRRPGPRDAPGRSVAAPHPAPRFASEFGFGPPASRRPAFRPSPTSSLLARPS